MVLEEFWAESLTAEIRNLFPQRTSTLIGQNEQVNGHRTEESDCVAQLTAPLSSRFCVQLVQTLDDVPVTNFTVTKVTLETGAPEGQRDRCCV